MFWEAVQDQNAVVETILGLEASGRIRLSKFVGTVGPYRYEDLDESLPAELDLKRNFLFSSFLIRITPEGRKYFQSLEQRDEQERCEPLVFISCGQFHPHERVLGERLERAIGELPNCKGYFAQDQSSLQALSDHVFRALDRCVGLVAVMHSRGEVHTPTGWYVRGSVWIEQEIAIAAFVAAIRDKDIPVILYVQKGINREGVRDFLILNTVEFEEDSEVVTDFDSRLRDGRFKPAVST
jgi:hypothetical protein